MSVNGEGHSAEFIILGAAGSTGVPAIGNLWGDCDPSNPKNTRLRTSALIKYQGQNIIIDTGPDFRLQANREMLDDIAAVLYTHDHGDHTNGIDELRVYKNRHNRDINIFGSDETLLSIQSRHQHMFESRSEFYPAVVTPHMLKAADMRQSFHVVSGLDAIPFEMQHGHIMSTGYRIGDLAYCADMSFIPDESLDVLKGINTLVVDSSGFNFPKSRVHANLEYVRELQAKLKPKNTILTVLSIHMDYAELNGMFPEHTVPAHDGLSIKIKF